jgi:hypothetical protein
MCDAGLMFGQTVIGQAKVILLTCADVNEFLLDHELAPGVWSRGDS